MARVDQLKSPAPFRELMHHRPYRGRKDQPGIATDQEENADKEPEVAHRIHPATGRSDEGDFARVGAAIEAS